MLQIDFQFNVGDTYWALSEDRPTEYTIDEINIILGNNYQQITVTSFIDGPFLSIVHYDSRYIYKTKKELLNYLE